MFHVGHLLFTYLVGLLGGLLFLWLHLPLAWILGPLSLLLIYKTLPKTSTRASLRLRKVSFAILGIQIGSTFTSSTLTAVTPYILLYTGLTLLLIAISLFNAYLVTKWIPIDVTTSLLGSIPGGLSAVLALSDSFNGNTVLVTIFQTIRLIAVLFLIPFSATHLFYENVNTVQESSGQQMASGSLWTLLIYIAVFLLALLLQNKVPAALVLIPMLVIAVLKINGIPLWELPVAIYLFAQLTIGVYLGNSIEMKDLWKAGKYCIYYLLLAIVLIAISFLFGYIFSMFTNLNLATAVLSLAPGGLIEMALTAQSVNGDPSIVSSLQMIRLLTIVMLLPFFLKWLLKRIQSK
ncbi:AbrB family transcriptional regulator [Sediminibacillus albus]|uniref:Membrane protein AbrB duplication n=1 Tax=Sediminibacillus albus TaxID=407036 RepID=A0A1G8VRI3_9BACI|nr:AbrB family transcriptional regulator [Sediminibacillus albus]SDJ68666.1 hypothetical protein SAMN05216243_0304 [Sediminibacillus albus]